MRDGNAELIDTRKNAILYKLPGHNNFYIENEFSPYNTFFITHNSGRAFVWNTVFYDTLALFGDTNRTVEQVLVSGSGKSMLVRYDDYSTEVISTQDWKVLRTIWNRKGNAAFKGKSDDFVLSSSNDSIRIFDGLSGDLKKVLTNVESYERFLIPGPPMKLTASEAGTCFLGLIFS